MYANCRSIEKAVHHYYYYQRMPLWQCFRQNNLVEAFCGTAWVHKLGHEILRLLRVWEALLILLGHLLCLFWWKLRELFSIVVWFCRFWFVGWDVVDCGKVLFGVLALDKSFFLKERDMWMMGNGNVWIIYFDIHNHCSIFLFWQITIVLFEIVKIGYQI